MGNTFLLCILGFIIGFPLPIIVALMLNSTKNKKLSKVLQTLFNGPHFISLVVLVGMLYLFFGRYGLVNNIIESVGGERYSFFLESGAFRPMYILSSNWQDFGWSSIVYLAALSGVDTAQHEAATIDGASRFQRVLHVDFPAIAPIVSVMLIMSIGGLMGVGYEKVLLMQTDGNLETSEIIATYVYKQGNQEPPPGLCDGGRPLQLGHQPRPARHRELLLAQVLRELALLRRWNYDYGKPKTSPSACKSTKSRKNTTSRRAKRGPRLLRDRL